MPPPRDLTAEALSRGALPGRGYVIARFLSQVLHPLFLTTLSLLIVGVYAINSQPAGLLWSLIVAVLQMVPLTTFYTIRLRQGAYSDEDVSNRHQRNELYMFGLFTAVVSIGILLMLRAPLAMVALLASALLINVLSWLINLSWKISIHAASMGSCATIALIYSRPIGIILTCCALALGWARVRTRNHSPGQVIAGMLLASFCVLLVFALFGLLW
jgi:membrane-associated phospholipid phosphatase